MTVVLPTTCACLAKLWELHIEQVQLCLPGMVVWQLSNAKGEEARRVKHINGDTFMCLKEVGQQELIGC